MSCHAPRRADIPVVDPDAADGVFSLLWLVIALPLVGAVILLVGGRSREATDRWGHLARRRAADRLVRDQPG